MFQRYTTSSIPPLEVPTRIYDPVTECRSMHSEASRSHGPNSSHYEHQRNMGEGSGRGPSLAQTEYSKHLAETQYRSSHYHDHAGSRAAHSLRGRPETIQETWTPASYSSANNSPVNSASAESYHSAEMTGPSRVSEPRLGPNSLSCGDCRNCRINRAGPSSMESGRPSMSSPNQPIENDLSFTWNSKGIEGHRRYHGNLSVPAFEPAQFPNVGTTVSAEQDGRTGNIQPVDSTSNENRDLFNPTVAGAELPSSPQDVSKPSERLVQRKQQTFRPQIREISPSPPPRTGSQNERAVVISIRQPLDRSRSKVASEIQNREAPSARLKGNSEAPSDKELSYIENEQQDGLAPAAVQTDAVLPSGTHQTLPQVNSRTKKFWEGKRAKRPVTVTASTGEWIDKQGASDTATTSKGKGADTLDNDQPPRKKLKGLSALAKGDRAHNLPLKISRAIYRGSESTQISAEGSSRPGRQTRSGKQF